MASTADWHLLECGSYGADLTALRELARGHSLVADLGCGCGRVARELARTGPRVVAIDRDPILLTSLRGLASQGGLDDMVQTREADLSERGWSDGLRRPTLAIAAMQLWQVMSVEAAHTMASEVARWLRPGGKIAAAVLDPGAGDALEAASAHGDGGGLDPTLREVDGWVLSSQVIDVRESKGSIEVHRLREQVSPRGEIISERSVDSLRPLSPDQVADELRRAGFEPVQRIGVPPEPESVSCAIIVAEVMTR